MLGVPRELIERHGAVSEEVARAMAEGGAGAFRRRSCGRDHRHCRPERGKRREAGRPRAFRLRGEGRGRAPRAAKIRRSRPKRDPPQKRARGPRHAREGGRLDAPRLRQLFAPVFASLGDRPRSAPSAPVDHLGALLEGRREFAEGPVEHRPHHHAEHAALELVGDEELDEAALTVAA